MLAFFEPSTWDHSFRLLHSSCVTAGDSGSIRPVEDQTLGQPAIQTVQVKDEKTFGAEEGVIVSPNKEQISGSTKEGSTRLLLQAGATFENKECSREEEDQSCGVEEGMETEPEICPEVRDLISRVEQEQQPGDVLQRAILSGWCLSYIIIIIHLHHNVDQSLNFYLYSI